MPPVLRPPCSVEQNTLNKLCNGITTINDSIKALDAVHQKAEGLDGGGAGQRVRTRGRSRYGYAAPPVDAMEEIVAADYWPVPTYDDIPVLWYWGQHTVTVESRGSASRGPRLFVEQIH